MFAAAKAKGVGFLDAPVSGGQAGAENGKLTIMVGGDAATFARARERARDLCARGDADGRRRAAASSPRWSTRSASRDWCEALSEGIHFAMRAGLDPERVLDVISKGAAQSWQMENRGKTMIADKFDFGFAVDWMRKDLVDLPRRGAAQRRRRCRSPRSSTSSTRRCRRAAAAAGTRRASSGCSTQADERDGCARAPASRRARRRAARRERGAAATSTLKNAWMRPAPAGADARARLRRHRERRDARRSSARTTPVAQAGRDRRASTRSAIRRREKVVTVAAGPGRHDDAPRLPRRPPAPASTSRATSATATRCR